MKNETPRDPRSTDSLDELIGDDAIGHEGRAGAGDHAAVRTWLRLLACTTQIETEIRRRLRTHFDMTLPRFDYLAQLHRFHAEQPEGLRMSQLSRYLMVTGGNVTSLTDELEKGGHVTRNIDPDDRRSIRIALTTRGRRAFEKIAAEHERWVVELLADLSADESRQLHTLLGHLRLGLTRRLNDKA
ncbi:MarR family transcriptional regulator [Ideonella azotifigens]|uniref:MarR family transcriptional regulator n=1 Tax=Ideonella azotifigens TaxID=513160 RepID=A0ABP3UUP0_9BURK|nr:MarR family transcriptional regulator [Ideonella azotifigens]MCD2341961.1 MarR family transcriptional regulator [Ideonella azotifigens]